MYIYIHICANIYNVFYFFLKATRVQGGEDPQDALSCRSFLAKEPLIIGLFCGKRLLKIGHPMSLRHPVHFFIYISVHFFLYIYIYVYAYLYQCIDVKKYIVVRKYIDIYVYTYTYTYKYTICIYKYKCSI